MGVQDSANAGPVGDPVVPLGYHREFALQRRPAHSSVVWLGAYGGSMAVIAYSEHLHFDAGPAELPKAVVTTFSVGRVLFQVLHHFTAGLANLRDDGRTLAAGLHRVWPPGPSVAWPRGGLAFGDTALADLSKSIQDDGGDVAD
jgi:hypothetical protein